MKYPAILALRPEPTIVSYGEKDTILYALSVGMSPDPDDRSALPFVYESGLRAMPTMATILARGPAAIMEQGGLDFPRIVHGEQRLRVHKPLTPCGRLRGQARCAGVVDKGADKGALVMVEETLTDCDTGDLHATLISTLFCRGDGGFGGPVTGASPLHEVPARTPDHEVVFQTRPDQALLYRLNGDLNPLHADPTAAAAAGFDGPILHGLCTYGVAARAVLQACCDHRPERIRTFDVRFAAPVFPGEPILTRLWIDGSIVSFDCTVPEREATVIRNGRCSLAG